jgi:hypothetical protein
MSDTKYNGWTNYATWRINLEVFDGLELEDFGGQDKNFDPELICLHTLAEALQERAEEIIFLDSNIGGKSPSSLLEDYARAFLQDVNYYEIAEHLVQDHIAENQEEEVYDEFGVNTKNSFNTEK